MLTGLDAAQLVREGWIPVRELAGGRVLVAVARVPRPALVASIERTLGRRRCSTSPPTGTSCGRCSPGCASSILDQAALGLWRRSAAQSARVNLYPRQRLCLVIALVLLGACAWRWPWGTLQAVSVTIAFGFLVGVAFKFVVCMAGARRENATAVTDEEVAALRDERPAGLHGARAGVPRGERGAPAGRQPGQLDYPAEQARGAAAARGGRRPRRIERREGRRPARVDDASSRCPTGSPQTKPKACNVGLFLATGEYLVIYDAEDRPEPDQLKKAVVAFAARRRAAWSACRRRSTTSTPTRTCSPACSPLEYSYWFDYMLPGLDACDLPIPLGGTSNHFRTDALRELGGWDPYNVTEDADLGIRAALGLPRRRHRLDHVRGGQQPSSATGSASAAAGSRATCRPRSCTCAARAR